MLPELSLLLMMKWGAVLAAPFWFYFSYFNHGDSEFEQFLKNIGIVVGKEPDIMYCRVIKRVKNDFGYTYTLRMPLGITSKDFSKHQDEIEEYLGGKTKFTPSKNNMLMIDMLDYKLKDKYPFELLDTEEDTEFYLGVDDKGHKLKFKLDDSNPHMVIGGSSGSGKSVIQRVIILYLILRQKVILHLIDLKGSEFPNFEDINGVEDVILGDDIKGAVAVIQRLISTMLERNKMFKEVGVSDIKEYNELMVKRKGECIKYHVCIIDEFKNLSDDDDIMALMDKIIRLSRNTGIYMILATQRPDAQTIKGAIKANITATLAFRVRNRVNSQILLDNDNAAHLMGKGHGILSVGYEDIEFKGYYISAYDAKQMIKHLKVDSKQYIDTSGVINHDPARKR